MHCSGVTPAGSQICLSVCLSTLLTLDVEAIETITTDCSDCHSARMCKFIDILETFPAYLVFAPGKRLADKPHGWAPVSFMPKSFGMPFGGQHAIQSSLGIVAELAAILFQPAPTPLRDIAFFQVEDDDSWNRLTNLGYREDDDSRWYDFGPHSISKPAIASGSGLREGLQDLLGALVSIVVPIF